MDDLTQYGVVTKRDHANQQDWSYLVFRDTVRVPILGLTHQVWRYVPTVASAQKRNITTPQDCPTLLVGNNARFVRDKKGSEWFNCRQFPEKYPNIKNYFEELKQGKGDEE